MAIRIMLADDHEAQRELVRGLVEREAGMEVVGETGDGMAAVDMARLLKPDVVLLDIDMPGLNGIDAAARICGGSPAPGVIGLSLHCEPEYAEQMRAAGAGGYLPKECICGELVDAVRAVSAGGIYVSVHVKGNQGKVANTF